MSRNVWVEMVNKTLEGTGWVCTHLSSAPHVDDRVTQHWVTIQATSPEGQQVTWKDSFEAHYAPNPLHDVQKTLDRLKLVITTNEIAPEPPADPDEMYNWIIGAISDAIE